MGSLVVNPSFGGEDFSFQHNLGVGRHEQIIGLAFDELRRMSIKAAEDFVIWRFGRHASESGEFVERRTAKHDRNRHVLPARVVLESIEPAPMGGAGHVEVLLVDRPEHGAIDPPVDHTGIWIFRHDQIVIG